MSDELAERLYVWLAVKSFGQVTALQAGSRVADLIRKDPQAHIDALVEAGVLRATNRLRNRYMVLSPDPPHDHEWWGVTCCTNRRGTAETVYVECACGESRAAVPNRLPIEVPE